MLCPLCKKETKKRLSDKIRSGEDRSVCLCPVCELGILDDRRSQKELQTYYQQQYRQDYKPSLKTESNPEDLFNSYVDFQQERIDLVKPYLGKDKRLLEIGCSAGMFLYHISGKVKEIVGMDFDVASAQFAEKKCCCQICTEPLSKSPLKEKSFDIICAFQVLEHVKDPVAFLREVGKYLKDDGILFVEVPNLHDVLLSTYDLKFHKQFYFHAAHLYYFSKKSFSLALEQAGFSGDFHFLQDYNLTNHFNWISCDSPQSNCRPGLSLPKFPLRSGVNEKVAQELNGFLRRVDEEYKAMLARLELSSNLAFLGKKVRNEA